MSDSGRDIVEVLRGADRRDLERRLREALRQVGGAYDNEWLASELALALTTSQDTSS